MSDARSYLLDDYEAMGRNLIRTNGSYNGLAPRCPHCGGELYLELINYGKSEGPFACEWRCVECVKWAFVEPPGCDHPNGWTALVVMGLGAS